ncbi:hypothetical protein GCM10027030_09220 [Luteococcus sediminum]
METKGYWEAMARPGRLTTRGSSSMWRKIMVVVLGLAMAASMGLGALSMQPSAEQKAQQRADELMTSYDEQAQRFWTTGSSQWPVIEQTFAGVRESVAKQGLEIIRATSDSSIEQASQDNGRTVVEASTRLDWTVTGDKAPEGAQSGHTYRHVLTFDEAGTLLSDQVTPEE